MTLLILLPAMALSVDIPINEENFPDANFRAYLMDTTNIETNFGDVLSQEEIDATTGLYPINSDISDLTGIEYFTALEHLECYNNKLTSLDVSGNTALTNLYCYNNNLTSLDVSGNTALTELYCQRNSLTSLDFSNNTVLKMLNCFNNNLVALDVSNNIALEGLFCYNNSLTTIDVSKNAALTNLNCNNNILTALDISNNAALKSLNSQNNYITDTTALEAWLEVEGHSGNVLPQNASSLLHTLTVNLNGGIGGTTGGEFPAGKTVPINAGTRQSYAFANWTSSSGGSFNDENSASTYFTMPDSNTTITANWTYVIPIDETNFPDEIFRNYIMQDLGFGDELTDDEIAKTRTINVGGRGISNLKGIEHFTALISLDCSFNNLTSLDVSKNTALNQLWCYDNNLNSLDVSKNTALNLLWCHRNNLNSLDVSKNTKLNGLLCQNNSLTALDISNNASLNTLYCHDNFITNTSVLEAWLAVEGHSGQVTPQKVYALTIELNGGSGDTAGGRYPAGASVPINAGTRDGFEFNGWTSSNGGMFEDAASASTNFTMPDSDTTITANWTYDIPIDETNFPDENFRNYLSQERGFGDTLSSGEAAATTEINVFNKSISSLKGIEYFTAITSLNCSFNNLTSLDVSLNTALTDLSCYYNNLTSLDISSNTALTNLQCNNNRLTALNISNNTALTDLYCYINSLTALNVSNNTALIYLYCNDNNLTALDVSKNTALKLLYCNNNSLNALNVSNNTALTNLNCNNNNLVALDVSKNAALITLWCDNNNLTSLNISNNTALYTLLCNDNNLVALDVSKNTKLRELFCQNNYISNTAALEAWLEVEGHLGQVTPQKTLEPHTLTVNLNGGNSDTTGGQYTAGVSVPIDAGTKDDFEFAGWASSNGGTFEDAASASTNFTMPDSDTTITANWMYVGDDIPIDAEHFPDDNFRDYLTQEFGDTLTADDVNKTTDIDISDMSISSLKGIEYFTALKELSCSNSGLTSLDLSKNTALTRLECYSNKLTAIDVSKNAALISLDCSFNNLTSLDVSKNTALTNLYCHYNNLTTLDVSKNAALISLDCSFNNLTSLDVSKNTELNYLECESNNLVELNVSQNAALETLDCGYNNLAALDVSKNTELNYLECESNNLVELNVSSNTALRYLECNDNNLVELNISSNTALYQLYCHNNYITDPTALEAWLAQYGHYGRVLPQYNPADKHMLTVDLNGGNGVNTTGEYVPLTVIPIDAGTREGLVFVGWTSTNGGTFEDARSARTNFIMPPFDTTIMAIWMSINADILIDAVHFPDDNFRNYLIERFGDTLSPDEVAATTDIDVSDKSISDLTGIEYFVALGSLNCGGNNLTELNVSSNTALTSLGCSGNNLKELNISNNTMLITIDCSQNSLVELNVSNNTALKYLRCNYNNLTSLDVSKNTALNELHCSNNSLTSLDVSKNTALTDLGCYDNDLNSLDVPNTTALTYLGCDNNNLNSLNVSKNTALTQLYCSYNKLTSLDVSKNTALIELHCSGNRLTTLDVSKNVKLYELYCHNNCISDTAALEAWLAEDGHYGQVLPQYAVGDANDDGVVNNRDVVTILKWSSDEHFSPTDDQLIRGDVNGDGSVTIADAQLLIKLVAGLDG